MKTRHDMTVRMVPIAQIHVLNTRSRGRKKFELIVENIAALGLKKPVLLARRKETDDGLLYDLVCGEGRINAMKGLGETMVPALIIDATREEALLMSLAENIARKRCTTLDMAREIGAMRERGHKPDEIAKTTGLDVTYVSGILRLLKHGESRLISAVQHQLLPLSVAVMIAGSTDEEVRQAMKEAYEKGELRGRALHAARRVVEKRLSRGKGWRDQGDRKGITAQTLLKAYKRESVRQQMLVSRARVCETRLRFVVSAVKRIMSDEGLINLLKAEGLSKLPQYLTGQLDGRVVTLG